MAPKRRLTPRLEKKPGKTTAPEEGARGTGKGEGRTGRTTGAAWILKERPKLGRILGTGHHTKLFQAKAYPDYVVVRKERETSKRRGGTRSRGVQEQPKKCDREGSKRQGKGVWAALVEKKGTSPD